MIRQAPRRDALRTHRRWRVPDGVTLLELLCAVVVLGVLATAGFTAVTTWNRAHRASRVAALLRWEITVARSYAIRSGRPMSLVVDEHTRSVTLHDGTSMWRRLSLGSGTRMEVDRIRLDLPGDSLVFSPRGLCITCDPRMPSDLSVHAGGRSSTIQVGMLGHPDVATDGDGPTH